MSTFLGEFLAVALLHFLALVSPGPDFIMITRNSLIYSRTVGVYSSLGLALGILVHITYSLIGLAYIISQSIVIFSTLKYLGAAYLIYIGYKSLRSKTTPATTGSQTQETKSISNIEAVKIGFLTNALNPKATLFFLALFTQVIKPETSLGVKILYGVEMSVMTFAWFAFVSLVLSHKRIKSPFIKIQSYVEKTTGAVLIMLGLKVALSKQ